METDHVLGKPFLAKYARNADVFLCICASCLTSTQHVSAVWGLHRHHFLQSTFYHIVQPFRRPLNCTLSNSALSGRGLRFSQWSSKTTCLFQRHGLEPWTKNFPSGAEVTRLRWNWGQGHKWGWFRKFLSRNDKPCSSIFVWNRWVLVALRVVQST